MIALRFSLAIQGITAMLLFLQDSASVNSTINGITAFGTFANLVVLIGLIYKIGRYTGTTDTTIQTMEKSIQAVTATEEKILSQQHHHGEALARLEVESKNMQSDLRTVRDRQHDLANTLTRMTLSPVPLRPIGRDPRESSSSTEEER